MATQLNVRELRAAMMSQGVSQAELVRRSGISRAQLGRILARDQAPVRDQTISRLARELNLDPAALAVDGRYLQYLDWVAAENKFVDFRGLGMPQFQRQMIDEIFVEPDLVGRDDDDDCSDASTLVRWRESQSAPSPASEVILKQDRMVLVGHPGSGKTTLLRWLAYRAASGKLAKAVTPIYVRLPDLSRALEIDPNAEPVKFTASIAAKRGCPNTENLLYEKLSDKTHCLVLLDGLDEVGDEERRQQLVEAISAFVERYPRNRFVLTSRIVGFDPSPWTRLGFSVRRLVGYGPKQFREFSKKWAKILPKVFGGTEDEARDSLSSAIFLNPRVRTLASNPLVLTILALLNASRAGALPRRRVDLYAKVVEVFLETWERTKESVEGFDETSDIDLDAREFGWLLSDVALAMQRSDRTLAARWWIGERIQDCLQNKLGFEIDHAKDVGERILRYLTERTGLIEERGLDQFAFSHRTLQEYFAAIGVIDESDASARRDVSDQLKGYFFNPRWSEVVRLVAARVTPAMAESIVSTILDDPDRVGRDVLYRGPILALRCLSDGATVPNRRLISGIFDSVAELGRSRWLGVTLEAIEALDAFRGTRLEQDALRTIRAILETAQRELAPDEYACLYQHANREEIFEKIEKQLGADFESTAASEVIIPIDGRPFPIIYFNAALRISKPDAWFKSLCDLVQDDGQSSHFRRSLVRELGREIETHPLPRRALRKLVESEMSTELRAEAVDALATGTQDATLLQRVLERSDEELTVRSACASSLRSVACADTSVAAKLIAILDSADPDSLRIGAARGLSKLARRDRDTANSVLEVASRESASDKLRSACAWALQERMGLDRVVYESFKGWLDGPEQSRLRRIAAQMLADWMAGEPSEWDHEVVAKIEDILMHLEDPCPHALDSLVALATTREVRLGLRLENVLRDAIESISDRVELVFVFGSTARNRQTRESDIDLMVVGDIGQKELSTPLRNAEKKLGRRISPVPNSRDEVQRKYQAGDPFIIDVYRREKIPVWPTGMSKMELEDEFRAMVAE